jgi:hypothetical protein
MGKLSKNERGEPEARVCTELALGASRFKICVDTPARFAQIPASYGDDDLAERLVRFRKAVALDDLRERKCLGDDRPAI